MIFLKKYFHVYCKEKSFSIFNIKNAYDPPSKRQKNRESRRKKSEKIRSYSLSLSFYILKINVQVWEEADSLFCSTGLK